ncbi:MAG: virulence protein [Clostridiaceae bacterium]|nr:virulence protein [Clostridiaceae bacterium]
MKINYSVTGPKRKALVKAIAQELGTSPKYLGVPTFSYEIGIYIIDRNGVLEGEDNPELVADLLGLHDFKAVSEEYDRPLLEAEPIPEGLHIPYEVSLGGNMSPYRDYEEPSFNDSPEDALSSLTIELPKIDFTEVALENLKGLIKSKETLIKKALGVNYLPVLAEEETISFPWFIGSLEADEIKAYTHFIAALADMAKRQKRVNATEKAVANEKYAFRCFLLRLGFIGPKYKMERKILLCKLTGSSAFKNGQPANEEATK